MNLIGSQCCKYFGGVISRGGSGRRRASNLPVGGRAVSWARGVRVRQRPPPPPEQRCDREPSHLLRRNETVGAVQGRGPGGCSRRAGGWGRSERCGRGGPAGASSPLPAQTQPDASVLRARTHLRLQRALWQANRTPLHFAAAMNRPDLAELLLKHGAQIDAINSVRLALARASLQPSWPFTPVLPAVASDCAPRRSVLRCRGRRQGAAAVRSTDGPP